MIRNNYLLEKLNNGDSVIGTWSIIPSPIVTDILCSAGLDFIIVDGEHGPTSFETAQEMVIVCESRNVSPIMRVSGVNETEILRALDIGMHGVQVPNINNSTDIETLIKYAKYPPIGNRGFSPFTRAGDYSMKNSILLTERANENTLIGVNVEGEEAIKNIEEILSIQELDIIFIGLFDISKALGIPGEVHHTMVQERLIKLIKKINDAGKFPGTIATDLTSLAKYKELGVKYILYLVDCSVIKSAFEVPVKTFKELNS
jgi:4-hydroxy-2-oxoheptanedioate aldolase|tara:strand:+ start:90 stop:866 length:777 start_codon:yes stop_codon:yes gene_type:complete